jgi:uncharacterized protein YhdP
VRGRADCHEGSCNVSFSLDSSDAQATLATYGLRPDLGARHATLSGELSWSRDEESPLASLSGNLHMLISDGATRPPAADAGAPFPLFVVPALLAGIAPEHAPAPTVQFARLAASYEVRDGVASTADLHLDGDAEMLVRARLGLVAGDYDGEAVVLRGEARLPKALRGLGPTPKVAAVWLALRDWLSGGGAGERGRAELRLRGTWEDPIVSVQ